MYIYVPKAEFLEEKSLYAKSLVCLLVLSLLTKLKKITNEVYIRKSEILERVGI